MGHARKFGAFHLYLILFIFFGSEVNVCSEETVVGEFEVRYPIIIVKAASTFSVELLVFNPLPF